MNHTTIWVVFILLFLLHTRSSAVEEKVKKSLIDFLGNLSNPAGQPDPGFGWNINADPCRDKWEGVTCDSQSNSLVKQISLNRSSLSGVFDARSLCNVQPLAASLTIIKLDQNNIVGQLPAEVADCKNLTHLLVGHNQFSGNLPETLPKLNNLKKLVISNNNLSGNLPDISRISGLIVFLAQDNQLTGEIPKIDFSNFQEFNVSFNDFSGPIPNVMGRLNESSFMNNTSLCGPPLEKPCLFAKNIADMGNGRKSKGASKDKILLYTYYGILGLIFFSLIIFMLVQKRKKTEDKCQPAKKVASVEDSIKVPGITLSDNKTGKTRLELLGTSAESSLLSSSLIVLTSPVVNGLKFVDLLRAPAEILGRGKHGSLYTVMLDNGTFLAVKRIKDWEISSNEFKHRMEKIYLAGHPNVLPPLAFYCSTKRSFAARIAEALTFMHQALYGNGIAHGNLKSSNILLNTNMDPCISEYGLMVIDNQDSSSTTNLNGAKGKQQTGGAASDAFKADIYGFGLILLELLTGKLVQNDGIDLNKWVHSVVREEWTVEAFDKSLISEGASEERMVNLLQVAVKCVDQSGEARPTINQVAVMINTIKEEEERSITNEA